MFAFVRSRSLLGAAAAAALAAPIILAPAGAASQRAGECFGGPPIGPTGGSLTEANLHQLVADMTLAQKVGFVHGQPESSDPQFGCGNTGQPNAFPVIN